MEHAIIKMKNMSLTNRINVERKSWQNNPMPLISFPIASYNRADILLKRTIPSILKQSYKNIEIIIVGDCMSDSNFNLLKNKIYDERVKIFNLNKRTEYPNSGFDLWCVAGYRPRNIGTRLSKGEWLWWISDDDILLEGACEKFVSELAKSKHTEIFYGNYEFGNEKNKIATYTLANNPAPLPFNMTGMPSLIIRSYLCRLIKWNGKSHKNIINKPSDYDMLNHMHQVGCNFQYIDHSLSRIIPSEKYDNLHGSKLYMNYPEVYK